MRREQVKKSIQEIEFWANGGNLWKYSKRAKQWVLWLGDIYDFMQAGKESFVMEDDHFEARKAFALGDPIEVSIQGSDFISTSCPNWNGVNNTFRPRKCYDREEWLDKFVVDMTSNTIHKVVAICPGENEIAICVVDDIYKNLRFLQSSDLAPLWH